MLVQVFAVQRVDIFVFVVSLLMLPCVRFGCFILDEAYGKLMRAY